MQGDCDLVSSRPDGEKRWVYGSSVRWGLTPARGLGVRLQGAGFVDICVFRFKQPFGPWPRIERPKCRGRNKGLLTNRY